MGLYILVGVWQVSKGRASGQGEDLERLSAGSVDLGRRSVVDLSAESCTGELDGRARDPSALSFVLCMCVAAGLRWGDESMLASRGASYHQSS